MSKSVGARRLPGNTRTSHERSGRPHANLNAITITIWEFLRFRFVYSCLSRSTDTSVETSSRDSCGLVSKKDFGDPSVPRYTIHRSYVRYGLLKTPRRAKDNAGAAEHAYGPQHGKEATSRLNHVDLNHHPQRSFKEL
ncbi:Uncharacterized protein DAT39_018270 [Clarias magur]|uniref:Uncharacterized protein n=1 Tax=Clarias magur TaxID=1594786 RepID=A0A8J4UBI6_CLAMG|nr:Uncharacterized protein DAT39_018270 [Clarias magur]